jgi:hypothetical protein
MTGPHWPDPTTLPGLIEGDPIKIILRTYQGTLVAVTKAVRPNIQTK